MGLLYLIKFGELSLKGENRPFFERVLVRNIKRKLAGVAKTVRIRAGRMFLEVEEPAAAAAERALASTFGIVGYARALRTVKTYDDVRAAAESICRRHLSTGAGGAFKIAARRSDKSFPYSSYEIARRLGADLLASFPELCVDVRRPELTVHVEIRDRAFLYGNDMPGRGGIPVGAAGRGVLLLSGGIDSPVAGYLMAKRGLRLDAAYFHTYPYTSDKAKEKVEALCETLAPYCSGITLFVIPFTEASLRIRERARPEEMTLLLRASMMACASELAQRRQALCLVTGESLSQVASQTVESMRFTEDGSDYPVFRPLIGMDKEEIVRTARSIGTYETSVLPFEDCCTVFAPERPLIRPKLDALRAAYAGLSIEPLLGRAVDGAERLWYEPQPGDGISS